MNHISLFNEELHNVTRSPKTESLLRRIENIIIGLLESSPPSIVLKNYKHWKNVEFTDRINVKSSGDVSEKTLHLHNRQHRTMLMMVVRLLAKIYKLLSTNSCVTRRELYYEEVQIISCQRTVDAAIQIICCLLDCPPWDIGIMASSKGLAKGPLIIKNADNTFIDCSSPEGTLIPFSVCFPSVELRSSAKFILLVEKDAIFQRLLNENICAKMKDVLLITGKGYPDVNTRVLVRKLNHDLKLPVLALVDADPFGIAIMSVYRFGSLSMSRFSKFLATPDIKWLGIHPTDINTYKLPTVALNQYDFSKLRSLEKLIELAPLNTDLKPLSEQIQYLLQNRGKAEIEAVCNISSNYLIDVYIPEKIIRGKFC